MPRAAIQEDGTVGDGVITTDEIFGYLTQEIQLATDQKQHPEIGDFSDGAGSFFFLNRARLRGTVANTIWNSSLLPFSGERSSLPPSTKPIDYSGIYKATDAARIRDAATCDFLPNTSSAVKEKDAGQDNSEIEIFRSGDNYGIQFVSTAGQALPKLAYGLQVAEEGAGYIELKAENSTSPWNVFLCEGAPPVVAKAQGRIRLQALSDTRIHLTGRVVFSASLPICDPKSCQTTYRDIFEMDHILAAKIKARRPGD